MLELARMFPEAPIYTLVHDRGSVHEEIESHQIHTSPIQRWPYAPARFRRYLPFFPWAMSTFDLRDFELIISTSHCVAKAVRSHRRQRHVAYIHTPMRYIWDQLPHYLASLPYRPITAPVARLGATLLRRWDVATARRPDLLLANSDFVRQRITRVWGREAEVVYPPVDVEFFASAPKIERRGLLAVSALVPYKRLDLTIALARQRGFALTIVGEGPERARLMRDAPPGVRFVSGTSREELRALYAGAEALLFAAEEDFGIVPVEALAAGCPVVAYGRGGVCEIVEEKDAGGSGTFFREPTAESFGAALDRLYSQRLQGNFAPESLLARARCFDRASFVAKLSGQLVPDAKKRVAK